VAGCSPADVSNELNVRLQAVIVALQTMLRKHPSLYTIDIVSALKDLQIRTKSIVSLIVDNNNCGCQMLKHSREEFVLLIIFL